MAVITSHVHSLAADEGLTVLWATHLTDEVADSDRLVILHQGRVLADGRAGDIAAGLCGMILLFNGMQSSRSLVYDREMGSMRLLLTSPLSRWWLLSAKPIAGTTISLLQVAAFLAIAALFGIRMLLSADGGTLNPEEMTPGRVMDNIANGQTDLATCAAGYYITKSGRHEMARTLFESCAAAGYTGAMTWMRARAMTWTW